LKIALEYNRKIEETEPKKKMEEEVRKQKPAGGFM